MPDSPAGLADMPELTSGDGAIDDRTTDSTIGDGSIGDPTIGEDVDLAYAADDDAPPVPAATDTDIDAGQVPSATDADAPHFPDDAPPEAVAHHAELLDTAPSAGVSADAPVVAPEVPEVDVAPLGDRRPIRCRRTRPPRTSRRRGADPGCAGSARRATGRLGRHRDDRRRRRIHRRRHDAVGHAPGRSGRPRARRPGRDDDSSTHQ